MTRNKLTSGKMASNSNIESLCQHCGTALSDFLHQMEHHNAEVVCPSCGKSKDDAPPAGAQGKARREKEIDSSTADGVASSVKTRDGNGRRSSSQGPAPRKPKI